MRSQDRTLYEDVLRLRYWHHVMNEEMKASGSTVPIHLAFGHEAIAVAVARTMSPGDQLVLTHRNIEYNLAVEGSLKPVHDEYHQLESGLGGGRLGSMNLMNPSKGIMYTSSILGNNLPVACGLALAKCLTSEPGIVKVLMGDGSIEEGAFYEGLVFASSHRLRLMVIVENNDHSLASRIHERRCGLALRDICRGIGVAFACLGGNDVGEYVAALKRLSEVIEQGGPTVVEVGVVTHNQHAGPTPGWPTDPLNIDLADGLIVSEDAGDPVFVVRERVGTEAFDEMSTRVMAEPWSE